MGQLIINDAVYGFINIDEDILQRLINHPYFQRLGRINQLGMGAFVYPGARHTRFQHSLGALHLMRKALGVLTSKGYFIFDSEAEAALIAILLHDIGHGPYSHVLEKFFVNGITHEEITAVAMDRLNKETHGELSLAISIFKDSHPKHFLHELICSQLDADRLDYLCRDSFYTGVREGNVGALRLIEMLEIHPETERLAVNIKGIYTLENYLMSRRLMYWQVYLHKTVLAAEEVLRSALRRARLMNGPKCARVRHSAACSSK